MAYVHAMFSGKQKKRRVQLGEVSRTSRSTEGCLRGFSLSLSDEEDDGAAAFVTQRTNGTGSRYTFKSVREGRISVWVPLSRVWPLSSAETYAPHFPLLKPSLLLLTCTGVDSSIMTRRIQVCLGSFV